ncbi:hypothetical protein Tsubulata_043582 [Turnera subulata]|uniref:HECT-type E3 ubiquitin transferase n=1 Tax=Turnera subulata TaxID=218843 RepID=A0A9Q0FQP9_9ROSI|nr:hypothetical protein Tsubulata_043582 [Turnera subulata]
MDQSRKHQVSLRGASAREISRDALLEKVSQERELRNYARRAAASALSIQRAWRRYYVTKRVASRFQEEWEAFLNHHGCFVSAAWISGCVLRPFLFFFVRLSMLRQQQRKMLPRDIDSATNCFKLLLESINSTDSSKNFCSLALGTPEERRIWAYQAQRLITVCSFILAEYDMYDTIRHETFTLASLSMHLLVVLTDVKGWKIITDRTFGDANVAVKGLVKCMGSHKSGLYMSVRRHINTLDIPSQSQASSKVQKDDKFLITVTAITLALRPFNLGPDVLELNAAAKQYCLFLLTTPWLIQRLPAALLPALRHKSILSSCYQTLVILKDSILREMSELDQWKTRQSSKSIPPVGWCLANIISLATGVENDFVDPGGLNQSLDYAHYVHVVIILAENFLSCLDDCGWTEKENQDSWFSPETFIEPISTVPHEIEKINALKVSFMDLLRPVCQQWHLTKLLAVSKINAHIHVDEPFRTNLRHFEKLDLLDVANFYSYMLRIFSVANPSSGSLPVLNMLSFNPGYLTTLWEALERLLVPGNELIHSDISFSSRKVSRNQTDELIDKKQKECVKNGGNKWSNVLQKIKGKSQAGIDSVGLVDGQPSSSVSKDPDDVWDVEPMSGGPQKVSKNISCLLHLFCAIYSHLLLVLDDIEFYEKQVPFTLEQQRRIASVLNTLVYNGLVHNSGQENRPVMDSAVRCLHLLYERDCRHQFCPTVLWLSPAKKSRPPIALAARTHETFLSNFKSENPMTFRSLNSVVSATPHVYPFEERQV